MENAGSYKVYTAVKAAPPQSPYFAADQIAKPCAAVPKAKPSALPVPTRSSKDDTDAIAASLIAKPKPSSTASPRSVARSLDKELEAARVDDNSFALPPSSKEPVNWPPSVRSEMLEAVPSLDQYYVRGINFVHFEFAMISRFLNILHFA